MQWQIIEGTTTDGQGIEWQVSDGDVDSRAISYDFLTLKEAVECLIELVDYNHGIKQKPWYEGTLFIEQANE